MVAQPAAEMTAVTSSGEEPEPEVSPTPAEQEQAAPSMETMMALILQEVGGIKDAVEQVNARTTALEGAMADVSLSGSGELPTGRGSASAATMVATSAGRREWAPRRNDSRTLSAKQEHTQRDQAQVHQAVKWCASGAAPAQPGLRSFGSDLFWILSSQTRSLCCCHLMRPHLASFRPAPPLPAQPLARPLGAAGHVRTLPMPKALAEEATLGPRIVCKRHNFFFIAGVALCEGPLTLEDLASIHKSADTLGRKALQHAFGV
jgi:hypothetical protein